MPTRFNIGTSLLTSSLRLWNGTWGVLPAKTPAQLLELFDREDEPECRMVREALTELNMDVLIYPCPLGGQRFFKKRLQLQSKLPAKQVSQTGPLLHDPNTGKVLAGAQAIISYLFEHYLGQTAQTRLRPHLLNHVSAQLARLARGGQAIAAEASSAPRKKLLLYSFESSPFARLVRERLCALELPYQLINVGKLKWGEMGPAVRRLAPGPYQPIAGSKRDHFLQTYGKVQIPFLIDPNQNVELFESSEIMLYLEKQYAKSSRR